MTCIKHEAEAVVAEWFGWYDSHLTGVSDLRERITGLREALNEDRGAIDAEHLAHQREWSTQTFGPGTRAQGVVDHIRKELLEIEADPTDLKEWVDVLILAFDGAWRAGWEPQEIIDAIKAKQATNEAREWPDWRTMSSEKAIEHVRETRRGDRVTPEEVVQKGPFGVEVVCYPCRVDEHHTHGDPDPCQCGNPKHRHSCDREIRSLPGDWSMSGDRQDGERWTCSCGMEYVHVCDEAEGCSWMARNPSRRSSRALAQSTEAQS